MKIKDKGYMIWNIIILALIGLCFIHDIFNTNWLFWIIFVFIILIALIFGISLIIYPNDNYYGR